jgi:glycosyltransferase involved in cell wall biosynthesis
LKIAFLISSLSAGGAERVASILMRSWASAGHEVVLLTYQRPGDPLHYPVPDGVVHRPLAALARWRTVACRAVNLIERIGKIRRCLLRERPDVMVGFMTDVNVVGILAATRTGIPVIVSERTHPAFHDVGRLLSWMRARLYPRAAAVVVQTDGIASWCRAALGLAAHVIANPVEKGSARVPAPYPRRRLIAVGRLSEEKGFAVLIEAFRRLAEEFPDWDLVIYGEGAERSRLVAAAAGLGGRVSLPGVVTDIPERLREADVYVQSSRYEGFPNALCEALAAGCCVVAADAPGATRDILGGGEYGVLAPPGGPALLADALRPVMRDAGLRQAFSRKAAMAVAPFGVEKIAAEWVSLFREVSGRPAGFQR